MDINFQASIKSIKIYQDYWINLVKSIYAMGDILSKGALIHEFDFYHWDGAIVFPVTQINIFMWQ